MANTLFIGKVYHRFDELPSTNDWALKLVAIPSSGSGQGGAAKSKPPEGTVVRADSQSAGRGQFGSRWESAPGQNLTLSVILYPTWLEASAQFYLSMAVALAVKDAVIAFNPTPDPSPKGRGAIAYRDGTSRTPLPLGEGSGVGLKWPNDLYLGDRKTAGILIQNILSGQHLQTSVVGIGLNVNQMEFDPALPNPTSLSLFFGKKFDLDALAERLFECLERRYLQLKAGQRAALKAEYEQSLLRLGEPSKFVRAADGLEFPGTIQGVTDAGRLRLETETGEEIFDLKEIKFVF